MTITLTKEGDYIVCHNCREVEDVYIPYSDRKKFYKHLLDFHSWKKVGNDIKPPKPGLAWIDFKV